MEKTVIKKKIVGFDDATFVTRNNTSKANWLTGD